MNIFILFVFCVLFSIALGGIFESDALLIFGAFGLLSFVDFRDSC